ncbi:MAG: RCC1 domain-containing protein, partial [Limisphaerales bacterium]
MTPRTKRRLTVTVATIVVAILLSVALIPKLFLPSPSKLPTGTRAPAVAIGTSHGVILAPDGTLWTWGDSTLHGWNVLGLGTNVVKQPTLRQIGADTNWVNVAVGGSTTLALKSDGSMWGWGENLSGQVGDGTGSRQHPTPVRSLPGNDWKQVACAGPHSVALKRDGSLWSWGNNWAGQLGNGTTNNSRTPVRVGSSTNWTRIWADLIQNVAQQNDGSLWFWGWDYSKSSKGSSISVPTRVSPDTNWVDVGMGDWMDFAIKSDGTLWAWGRLAHCFSTAQNSTLNSSPVQVGRDTDWRACAHFQSSTPLFMKRDGSLWVLDGSEHRGAAVVTKLVQNLVTNNQLNCIANSDTLGGDSAFSVVKRLQITYQLNGTNAVADFREDATVHLGDADSKLTITRALYGDPKKFADLE